LHQMRMTTKFVAGRYGELARLAEKTIEQFPADEDIRNWLNWSYVQLGLPEKVIDAAPQIQRLIAQAAGDHEAQRANLDKHGPWLDAEMHYAFAYGDEDNLVVAVDEYVSQLEEKNYPWRTECDTVHAVFMQKVGRKEAFESILAQCATEYEPALESGYFCYCSWIRVINYLILSGREEEAVRKLFEWFDNGGSDIRFEVEEVIAQLRGRPEYQQFLERNVENIASKRARYLQIVELATTVN